MSDSRREDEALDTGPKIAYVLLALAAVLGIWYAWATVGVQWMHSRISPGVSGTSAASPGVTVSELGQVGDVFGGVNALFAAVAVLGVFLAASLQRRALVEARQALKEERRSNAHQQFESNFFQMLQLTRDITANVRALNTEWKGSRLLDSWALELAREAWMIGTESDAALSRLRNLATVYERKFYMADPAALGPYFRSLFQTFKFVDQAPPSVITPEEKVRYSNIARGQISDGAVLLLAVNGITPRGERFAPLIEKYGLLEHMYVDYRETFQSSFALVYQPHAFLGSAERAATPTRPISPPVEETRALIANVGRQ